MNSSLAETLDTAALGLLDEIEASAGFEVRVRPSAKGRLVLPYERSSNVRVVLTHEEATIEHDVPIDQLPRHAVVHELLHLHRYLVPQVPAIMERRAMEFDTASAIDNDIEHLVIFERQLAICPEFASPLNEQLEQFWSRESWASVGATDLQFNLVVRAAATTLYCTAATKATMRKALAVDKIAARVRKSAERVIASLGDKRALVNAVFEASGIPTSSFKFRVLHPMERRYTEEDI
jgi:hypothetical protein